MLSERERKLLQLGLGLGAFDGEIDNAAVMFFRALRARGAQADQIEESDCALVSGTAIPMYSRPDYGLCTMPFGKHRDEMFKDIPPRYLHWILNSWQHDLDDAGKIKFKDLLESIENFLNQ